MKLLILTQYYPPEVGAPQNRLHELALRLKGAGLEIEVLTAMPNYPQMEIHPAYRDGTRIEEVIDGIRVYRSGIYVSTSKSIVSRLRNYFSFVWSSYRRGRKLGHYDFIMVESPPLFLGYSGMRLARKLNAKLIFNVSDLWPESAEKLEIVSNRLLLKLAYRLEAKCYRKATLVTCQTMGILDNIKARFPNVPVYWLPNGVDLDFYNPETVPKSNFRAQNGFSETDIVFFYGGILGYAQGLEVVLQAALILKDKSEIKIVLQGAGPEKEKLMKLKEDLKLQNVIFLPPVEKSQMPGILSSVDVALVPLRKLELFEGAIPSKIFEALSMKLALLLGVGGEAKEHFIDKAGAGYYFEPENAEDLGAKMLEFCIKQDIISSFGKNGRSYVMEHFNREKIAKDFYRRLNALEPR